eukprot:TRINITY_DN48985_c0_g1_i1.p1 TRINITY_DN48985_c0_g1~~TRINITY_DN48985_c0_g1_i1.p1  ORF type:complete len:373 (+),score=57.02 TRINITY_DN48985_c0_g1_i1:25-1143(+)
MDQQLALVPAPGAERERHRRRRHERRDGGSRSRSRQRRRHHSRGDAASGPPPADWRGATGPAGPAGAPADWRGPPPMDWQGAYGPPGAWPPRPMGAYPPQPMQRPSGQYAGWHVTDGRGEPPVEWRGPGGGSRPAPSPYGSDTGAWTPTGPPPSHWGGNAGGPPAHWGAPPQPAAPAYPVQPDPIKSEAPAASQVQAGTAPPAESPAVAEPALPAPPTPAQRLSKIRIVTSALGEQMLEKLRSMGVLSKRGPTTSLDPDDAADSKGSEVPAGTSMLAAGITGAAAAQAHCAHLGLLTVGAHRDRSRLPPPVQAKQRVHVCTLGLAHSGLWERFRQRCGTPLPVDPQPLPCELKNSLGGGQVVVPRDEVAVSG